MINFFLTPIIQNLYFNIQDIITNINISLTSIQLNGFYYENIKPLIVLPKDFYGLLLIDNEILQLNGKHQSPEALNQNGFLQITRV